jgi:hypothetical protein
MYINIILAIIFPFGQLSPNLTSLRFYFFNLKGKSEIRTHGTVKFI